MKTKHPLQPFARALRNSSTDTERLLWRHLRSSQLEGVKFRRQQTIEAYIVDFVSFEKRIVIELDGGQHAENQEYDEQRDNCLRANGFVVLRFWNNDVIQNIEGVLEVIRQQCLQQISPTPRPPPVKGGGVRTGQTDDLNRLAGTWSAQDAEEFERNTAVFEKVDEDMWK